MANYSEFYNMLLCIILYFSFSHLSFRALKTYSEKLRHSEDPKVFVGLSADDASRIESLLSLLEMITKNTSSSQVIATEIIKTKELSKSDFKEDITEQDMNLENYDKHTIVKVKQMASNDKVENISTAIGGIIDHDGCCTNLNPSGVNERTICSKGDLDKTKSDTCHKATHCSGSNCMTSISEGGVANEGACCCKENQNEKNHNYVESNPSRKHFLAHNTEEEVEDDGKSFIKLDYCKEENLSSEAITELDQDILMRDAYNKCHRLLMELGIDPLLNV